MLKVSSLFLELVVVILEHLDKLLEVFNSLLVIQLDRLERDAIVVWHICHAAQLAVFCRHVIHDVRQVVDLAHQSSDLLFKLFLLLAKNVNLPNRLLNVLVATIER